ncbi:hypothetical protein SAMN05421644_10471 [Allochromatium warmingii]|uniref:Uncharacterized protein n=1 Tax=Allochromatium warmingii TaxID=61595 RepID=A0A1H3C021_ALLWA|nr:hypothetical protein SAMN05421644_10471 [Allochromatium warmingii]
MDRQRCSSVDQIQQPETQDHTDQASQPQGAFAFVRDQRQQPPKAGRIEERPDSLNDEHKREGDEQVMHDSSTDPAQVIEKHPNRTAVRHAKARYPVRGWGICPMLEVRCWASGTGQAGGDERLRLRLAARFAEKAEEIRVRFQHHQTAARPKAGAIGGKTAIKGIKLSILREGVGVDFR